MKSLPDTSTHDQQWESKPRPFDLESKALTTWPHAPNTHAVTIRVARFSCTHIIYLSASV